MADIPVSFWAQYIVRYRQFPFSKYRYPDEDFISRYIAGRDIAQA